VPAAPGARLLRLKLERKNGKRSVLKVTDPASLVAVASTVGVE
jgi:hypothetical protein